MPMTDKVNGMTSKVKGHIKSRHVTWCVWQVLAHKSRRKSPINTKTDMKVVNPTGNNEHQFEGQKLKGQGL